MVDPLFGYGNSKLLTFAFLKSPGEDWALTERGRVLARTYHECDLLVAEAMASGALDDLDPATLAGLVSCFTYERRDDRFGGPPPTP